MGQKDYYDTLGISRDADKSEIKKAFKRLAREYHPDVAEDKKTAEQKFGEINEAYSVLSDDEKRAYYDRYGHAPGTNQPGGDPGGGFGGFGGGGFPFGDLFESIFDLGGGGRRQQARPARGADYRMGLRLTLEEAFQGVTKDVELTSDVNCPRCEGRQTLEADGFQACQTCHGTGQLHQVVRTPFGQLTQVAPCGGCQGRGRTLKKPCPECSGRGSVEKKRSLQVKVPAGIDTGKLIRMPGEGAPGNLGGPPGDLYLAIEVEPHASMERRGDDLFAKKSIYFTDAALGNSVEVDLLLGEKITLKVPPGTQNGTVFRFKGKGMPKLNRSSRGDLNVLVEVQVPTKLNSKQKKLLKEFAEAGSQEAEAHTLFDKIKDALWGGH
jgi:molecular chaperone DnaJ